MQNLVWMIGAKVTGVCERSVKPALKKNELHGNKKTG
jgi:hypothetical protein